MRKLFGIACLTTGLLSGCSGITLWQEESTTAPGLLGRYEALSDYETGKSHLRAGNYGLAITVFQKILERSPNSILAMNGLAIAYSGMGRNDVATDYLNKAMALEAHSQVTLNNMAYLNLKSGQAVAALDFAQRAQAEATSGVSPSPVMSKVIASNSATASAMLNGTNVETAQVIESKKTAVTFTGENVWQLNSEKIAQASGATARAKAAANERVLPAGTVLRVSNGTGRYRMARRFAAYLSGKGVEVESVANAKNFKYQRSVIFYNPGQLDAAQTLADQMPIPVKMVEAKQGKGRVEIVLGFDLVGFGEKFAAN